jgi:uncharacterized repeat protein (TIGR03803 family)
MINRTILAALRLSLCIAAVAAACLAAQPVFRVISNLSGYEQPGGLTEGSPGVFYSVASIAGAGTQLVFSVTAQGSIATLASFPGSQENLQSLVVGASNGRFYSVIEHSAYPATVFSVASAPGSQQVYSAQNFVPSFSQNLPDGSLLGGAGWGGIDYVITCSLDGVVTPVYQFPANQVLVSPAIYGSEGNYYGVEVNALAPGGYAYRVTPAGSLTALHDFPAGTFRGYSTLPLLQASDENLYGATIAGGANGFGSIYRLTLDGQYTLLHSFPEGRSAGGPTTLIEASDGNLYGAAQAGSGCGEIFRITKSGQYSTVYRMTNGPDGFCPCWLLQGSDGLIYGIAHAGGSVGAGSFFSLDLGLPKPRPQAQHFHPQSGAAGTRVRIWGSNLLSAAVNFNGVPATAVSDSGANYVWATVPSGAASGPITVTTPGGTITTRASFTVE